MPSKAAWPLAQTGSELPEITGGQFWIGVGVTIALALGLLYGWYRSRFAGLPPSNEDTKDTLWSQLYHRDPRTLRIPAGADPAAYRDEIRVLVTDREGRGSAREATVSGALADMRATAAQTYAPILERLPSSAVRTVQLAVLVVVLGAPAVSTAAILEALEADGGGLSVLEIVTALVDATVTVGTLGVDLLTSFPYAGTLFSLGLTAVMLGGEWLYGHWYVTATLLVGGAVAIVLLDRWREREYDGAVYDDRRNLAVVAAKRVGAVWAVGVAPAATFGVAGLERVGALLGFGLALAVGAYYAQLSAREAYRRLVEIAQWGQTFEQWRGSKLPTTSDGDSSGPTRDRALAGYLVVRRVVVCAWLIVAPLPVAYAVAGVSSGAYVDVLTALLAAPASVKAVVTACLLAPVAAVVYLGRGSLDDLVTGLRETWSRRRVRLAAFRRGVPIIAVVAASAIIYSVTEVVWLAAVGGFAVGVVARLVYELFMKAKYRVSMFDSLDPVDRTVVVAGYALEDTDGETRYYGTLNDSTKVMTDSPAAFVDAVVDLYPAVSSRGDPEPTVPMWRARFALEFGIVDPEETETKLTEKVRKRAIRELRDDEWAYRADLEAETDDLPETHLESWLRWARRHGIVSVREDRSGDDVVLLKRDPWRKRGRES